MSIRKRINSLFKSSISINGIRDSVTSFNDGITKANNTASEIVQKTNERNNFKRSLIGKDNEFFRRRRENVRRKDREDELEAASVQGIAARQGTVSSRSTKGFLGRIIDFFGIILIGWFVTQLPKILDGIQALIKRISKVINILTGFIGGIQDFLTNFGTGLVNVKDQVLKFDFDKQRAEADENLEKTMGGVSRLNLEYVRAANIFSDPENIGLTDFNEGSLFEKDERFRKKPKENPPQETENQGQTQTQSNTSSTNLQENNTNENRDDFKSVKETKKVEKVETDDDENVEGVINDPFIGELESKTAQSKGATIDQKNQENKDEKDEKDEDVSLKQKLEGFMSNMFGTKSKREKDTKDSSIEGVEGEIQEMAGKLGETKNLESAMAKFADSIKKGKKEGDSVITPLRLTRDKLVEDNQVDGNTVYLIETPVNMGGNNSGSMAPSNGGSKMQLNNNKSDQQNIFKRIQKIILS